MCRWELESGVFAAGMYIVLLRCGRAVYVQLWILMDGLKVCYDFIRWLFLNLLGCYCENKPPFYIFYLNELQRLIGMFKKSLLISQEF